MSNVKPKEKKLKSQIDRFQNKSKKQISYKSAMKFHEKLTYTNKRILLFISTERLLREIKQMKKDN